MLFWNKVISNYSSYFQIGVSIVSFQVFQRPDDVIKRRRTTDNKRVFHENKIKQCIDYNQPLSFMFYDTVHYNTDNDNTRHQPFLGQIETTKNTLLYKKNTSSRDSNYYWPFLNEFYVVYCLRTNRQNKHEENISCKWMRASQWTIFLALT